MRQASASSALDSTAMPWKPKSVNSKYGWDWQRLRKATLREQPLCRLCMAAGRTEPACIVDHIKPLADGGTNESTNLQPLCKRCHDAIKTPADVRTRKRADTSSVRVRCVPFSLGSAVFGFDTRLVRRNLAPFIGWKQAHCVAMESAGGVLAAAKRGDFPLLDLVVLVDDFAWAKQAEQLYGFPLLVDALGDAIASTNDEERWLASRYGNEYACRHGKEIKGSQQERSDS